MNKKLIFIFLTIFIISLQPVLALQVMGNRLSPIILQPGMKLVNHYTISGTDKEVEVGIGGDLVEFISFTEVDHNEFDLVIRAPVPFPEPGKYRFSMYVNEVGPDVVGGGGVGSLVAVTLQFTMIVPPHGKSITVEFDAPNVNQDESVPFTINVNSKGLEDVNFLQGKINVYDVNNNSVGSIETVETSLKALTFTKLTASFDTKGLPPANYWAEAIITYDGEREIIQDTFKIGDLDLILRNYSKELEQGYDEFLVILENNWGNKIKGIYGKLFISGQEVLHTPTISLNPWETKELKGIAKTDLDLGEYNASLKLFFQGEEREEKFIIKIVESTGKITEKKLKQGVSDMVIIAIALSISLVAAALIVWMSLRRKKGGKNRKK
jgi:hypothetical protein